MSKQHPHLHLLRPQPHITREKLWARHQELQAHLREAGALWQQAQDAIDTECEKPEIERDREALATMRQAQERITVMVEQTIEDLKQLDAQLTPYLDEQTEAQA